MLSHPGGRNGVEEFVISGEATRLLRLFYP